MSSSLIKLRMWRMEKGDPYGMHCWFDPDSERIELHALTDEEKSVRLDIPVSLSALPETETGLVHVSQIELPIPLQEVP